MITSTKKNLFLFIILPTFLIVGIIWSAVALMPGMTTNHHTKEHGTEYNKEVALEKNEAIKKLIAKGRYKCCMGKPCSRCFSKPGHQDEELVCDCLVDVMNGKHPCGECIGEILEGEGNPLIAEYFATAIAEKLGEQHIETLKQIISEKYGIASSQQL